jgi:hypothetical protein
MTQQLTTQTERYMTQKTKQPKDPALICVYGRSGSGKTTDCGYSFPNALFVAARGALTSITTTCGYDPAQVAAKDIADATKKIEQFNRQGSKYDAVVVDDFSWLAEQTVLKWGKKLSGYDVWRKVNEETLAFRESARHARSHIILNCWYKGPQTKHDGSYVRGGPDLPSKLPEQLPSMCDIVLQVGHDPMRKPWGGTYKCAFDSTHVMKDRFGTCYQLHPCPMNLGEILRASGYSISRLKELDWQEAVVEKYSTILADAPNLFGKMNELYAQLLPKAGAKAAAWTIRDAIDRMSIRKALTTTSTQYV